MPLGRHDQPEAKPNDVSPAWTRRRFVAPPDVLKRRRDRQVQRYQPEIGSWQRSLTASEDWNA